MSIEKSLNLSQVIVRAEPKYLAQESRPDQNLFVFSYRMQIQNFTQNKIQLISRHWIISHGLQFQEEVQGIGVVGLQPELEAGSSFEYESFCPLTLPYGSMKGFYHFLNQDGSTLKVEIPEFYLVAPQVIQ